VSPPVAYEDLVRRDPDFVLAGPVGERKLAADPAWRSLRAVRDGHVAVLDTNLVGRPSVRMGEAAWAIARAVHPDASALRDSHPLATPVATPRR